MGYLDILVHRATPVGMIETGAWVEGEYEDEPVARTPFDCCLFLPQGSKSGSGRSRQVTEPTLLYAVTDDAGADVALSAEDEVLVVAPELNVAQGLAPDTAVRYTITGAAQPFGRPGDEPVGLQVTLRRIVD